jgi:uncharacterized small protein (DUF1192 family)
VPEPIGEVERVAREMQKVANEDAVRPPTARDRPITRFDVLGWIDTLEAALAALRPDREQVSGEAEVEAIAQALADGAGGCTGGCSNRPCEVDYNDAKRIADALRASRQERPPGLTRSQARRIEDVLEELDVDERSWSEVEKDALRALSAVAEQPEPLPVDREQPEGRLRAEVARLRAWLRLVEASTDHDSGYYALHGYDAPSESFIEKRRIYPEHAHPGDMPSREQPAGLREALRRLEVQIGLSSNLTYRAGMSHALEAIREALAASPEKGERDIHQLEADRLDEEAEQDGGYEQVGDINFPSDPRPSPTPGRDPLEESLREIGNPDQIIADLRAEVARLKARLAAASSPLPAGDLDVISAWKAAADGEFGPVVGEDAILERLARLASAPNEPHA